MDHSPPEPSEQPASDTCPEEAWFIVTGAQGHCLVVNQSPHSGVQQTELLTNPPSSSIPPQGSPQQWGPFSSKGEAIARRVGLIRSGKCKPE